MTPTDRKRLRELAEKASPAPWHIGHVSEIDDGSYEIDASNGELICDNELPDNGLFIIAARTAIPQLLDLVEKLEDRLENNMNAIAGLLCLEEIECRGDEDCDHCHATRVALETKEALQKIRGSK
jgi:hypothetical protein